MKGKSTSCRLLWGGRSGLDPRHRQGNDQHDKGKRRDGDTHPAEPYAEACKDFKAIAQMFAPP